MRTDDYQKLCRDYGWENGEISIDILEVPCTIKLGTARSKTGYDFRVKSTHPGITMTMDSAGCRMSSKRHKQNSERHLVNVLSKAKTHIQKCLVENEELVKNNADTILNGMALVNKLVELQEISNPGIVTVKKPEANENALIESVISKLTKFKDGELKKTPVLGDFQYYVYIDRTANTSSWSHDVTLKLSEKGFKVELKDTTVKIENEEQLLELSNAMNVLRKYRAI